MELMGYNLSFGSPANMANCGGSSRGNQGQGGRGKNGGRGNGAPGRGRGANNSRNNTQRQGNNNQQQTRGNNNNRPLCQVCLKVGRTADRCWHRYDESYVPEPRHVAAAATHFYSVDINWYTDSGASDHMTGDLEKLSFRDKYHGGEQIHTASGTYMKISHIGKSIIHTSSHDLELNNIFHVPQAKKNSISVHRVATDNNVVLEYHPNFS
jgi:histone deacetylase 1/2